MCDVMGGGDCCSTPCHLCLWGGTGGGGWSRVNSSKEGGDVGWKCLEMFAGVEAAPVTEDDRKAEPAAIRLSISRFLLISGMFSFGVRLIAQVQIVIMFRELGIEECVRVCV